MAATKSPAVRLKHIRDEIAAIMPIIEGMSVQELEENYLRLRATERAILIISEAATTLPADLTLRYPEIDWRAVRGIGNVIRHEYERVETVVLWRVVTEQLPILGAVVDRMLADLER